MDRLKKNHYRIFIILLLAFASTFSQGTLHAQDEKPSPVAAALKIADFAIEQIVAVADD